MRPFTISRIFVNPPRWKKYIQSAGTMSGLPEASSKASQERVEELLESLADVRQRLRVACSESSPEASRQRQPTTTLVAVSKYKPASDILACVECGHHLDFGENYVQEVVDKAKVVRSIYSKSTLMKLEDLKGGRG